MTHLKLEEFRSLYRRSSRGWPIWAKHLLLGFLVWLETRYIDAKAKAEVDRAIAELDLPSQTHVPFTFFDDGEVMSITADFYQPTHDRTKPPPEAPEGH